MIKDLDAPYECKRSTFWMKWKPVITVDLNIVGFEQGTGRNLGRLGPVPCSNPTIFKSNKALVVILVGWVP
jgi:ATP-dependent DNA ligase